MEKENVMGKKEIEVIKERIEYIKSELAAEGHWDGWVVTGLKEELAELEAKLET